jgi:hypothetical protein
MATDLFSRSHVPFLLSLNRVRFRFDAKSGRLSLCLERVCDMPPAWVTNLKIEAVDERSGAQVPLPLEWEDVAPSLMTASCPCPEALRPTDFSQDFLPISEALITAGEEQRRLPNSTSLERFRSRKTSPDPNEDRIG